MMVTQVSSDFLPGSGGGSLGLFPVFPPKRTLQGYHNGRLEGFLGNGDNIFPPQSVGGGNLIYTSNTNSTIWSISPTNINPLCTAFVTFNLDSVDNLLWVLAQDDVNNRLYLATIDATGTIVNVGNAATAVSLNDAVHGWIANTNNRKGANMLRDVQGTGNFTVRATGVEFEIDYTNGNIVSETSIVDFLAGSFRSTTGIYFNPGNVKSLSTPSNVQGVNQNLFLRRPNDFNPLRMTNSTLLAPVFLGLPFSDNTNGTDTYTHLQWKGDIMVVNPGTTFQDSPALYDPVEYLIAVDSLVKNFRADL